jgi:peroxiredoxin Q/BCP
MNLPKVGTQAPEFCLKNQHGEELKLSDLIGKQVVVYFYPKAMTPGCTVQACGIRDYSDDYQKLNVVVLGVSPDPVNKLKKFAEKCDLKFNLLSDEDHAIAEKYGVWGLKKFMGREFMGVNRITFIIDESGKLTHILQAVKTKTHHDDLLALLSR